MPDCRCRTVYDFHSVVSHKIEGEILFILHRSMDKAYKNIWVLFFSILAFIFIGFFKSYFSLFPTFESIPPIQHAHALLFFAWFALLFIQPWLIRTGRFRLHRMLGKSTIILVPLMVLSIFILTKEQYYRELAVLPKEQCIANLIIPLPQVTLFVALYVLAILNVRDRAVHMRYIIGTSIVLIGPGLGRACISWMGMSFSQAVQCSFIVTVLLLAGLILYDIRQGNRYKPYAVLLALFITANIGWYLLPYSVFWQTFCGGFVDLFF